VATPYTIRYGRLNAACGPAGGGAGVVGLGSASRGFRGEAIAATLGEGEGALVRGGGSIAACEVGGLEGMAGSGRAGMSSSVPVSMVISLVSAVAVRRL